MEEWEVDELRKVGANKFDDAADDVDDDWENDGEAEPAPAPAKPVAEVIVKSAQELAEEIERKKKMEMQKNESPAERKAREMKEQEAAAQAEVDAFFSEPGSKANASEVKEVPSIGKGLEEYPLNIVEHFSDLADAVCIRVLSQKAANAQITRKGRVTFLNSLVDRFGAEFTADELKDLANRTKAMHQAKQKEDKEKAAAASAKRKGGKKSAPKKGVVVERDEISGGFHRDDVFDDDD